MTVVQWRLLGRLLGHAAETIAGRAPRLVAVTSYTLRKGNPARTRVDLVVVGVARDKRGNLVVAPGGEGVAEAYGRRWRPLLASLGFTAKPLEAVRFPTDKTLAAGQLVVVGLGERDILGLDVVRRAAGVAARQTGNTSSVALALPAQDAEHLRASVEGFGSGLYRFAGYKRDKQPDSVTEVVVLSDAARQESMSAALERSELVLRATARARDWVNTPPNLLTPPLFAEQIQKSVKKRKGLKVEVLDEEALRDKGAGGILGVGESSAHKPRLVKISWKPADARATLALVGKGITFDTGGLNLKPGSSMNNMKSDMAGAAAVVAAVEAIAEAGLPIAVTGWAPLAENAVSGEALRPSDVITMYDGRTVEIRNTDAEGRLLLADAMAMAGEQDPDLIVDVATLTGHVVMALGERMAGIFGDDATVARVEVAGQTAGELFWRLPITEDARKAVTDTKIADLLQHNLVRWGGALYAAAFLEQFADGRPWAHLDIAGASYNTGAPWGHLPAGATGFGVGTLVELADRLASRP